LSSIPPSTTKRRIGTTAIALLGLGAALLVPATAAFADEVDGVTVTNKVSPYAITVNCDLLPEDEDGYLAIREGETITITTENCEYYRLGAQYRTSDTKLPTPGYTPGITPTDGSFISAVDSDGSDLGSIGTVPPPKFTVNPNTKVYFYNYPVDPLSDESRFKLTVIPAPLLENPSGTLGVTSDVLLDATDVKQFEAIEPLKPDDDTRVQLGANPLCEMKVGPHAYATTTVNISIEGEYSFRLVNTDTLTTDLQFWQPSTVMRDPFLALYSAFDPTDPNANIVGCNDDINDLPTSPFTDAGLYAYTTGSDQLIGGRYPQFVSNLQPGSYTLVYTTFRSESAEDWQNQGLKNIGTFEMWGPEGGFDPQPGPSPTPGPAPKPPVAVETGR
jgi:hypothetical protein